MISFMIPSRLSAPKVVHMLVRLLPRAECASVPGSHANECPTAIECSIDLVDSHWSPPVQYAVFFAHGAIPVRASAIVTARSRLSVRRTLYRQYRVLLRPTISQPAMMSLPASINDARSMGVRGDAASNSSILGTAGLDACVLILFNS